MYQSLKKVSFRVNLYGTMCIYNETIVGENLDQIDILIEQLTGKSLHSKQSVTRDATHFNYKHDKPKIH